MAQKAAVLVSLGVFLVCGSALADVNAKSDRRGDRIILHLTNSDPYPVTLRFNFSYDFKCGEEFYSWQHQDAQQQGASVGAGGTNDVVYYFPPCGTSTQSDHPNIHWISSVRTDLPNQPVVPLARTTPQNPWGGGGSSLDDGSGESAQAQPLPESGYTQSSAQNYVSPQAGGDATVSSNDKCGGPLGSWADQRSYSSQTGSAYNPTTWVLFDATTGWVKMTSLIKAGDQNGWYRYTFNPGDIDAFSGGTHVSKSGQFQYVTFKTKGGRKKILFEDGSGKAEMVDNLEWELTSTDDASAALAQLASLARGCKVSVSLLDRLKVLKSGRREALDSAVASIEGERSAAKTVGQKPRDAASSQETDPGATRAL